MRRTHPPVLCVTGSGGCLSDIVCLLQVLLLGQLQALCYIDYYRHWYSRCYRHAPLTVVQPLRQVLLQLQQHRDVRALTVAIQDPSPLNATRITFSSFSSVLSSVCCGSTSTSRTTLIGMRRAPGARSITAPLSPVPLRVVELQGGCSLEAVHDEVAGARLRYQSCLWLEARVVGYDRSEIECKETKFDFFFFFERLKVLFALPFRSPE